MTGFALQRLGMLGQRYKTLDFETSLPRHLVGKKLPL